MIVLEMKNIFLFAVILSVAKNLVSVVIPCLTRNLSVNNSEIFGGGGRNGLEFIVHSLEKFVVAGFTPAFFVSKIFL